MFEKHIRPLKDTCQEFLRYCAVLLLGLNTSSARDQAFSCAVVKPAAPALSARIAGTPTIDLKKLIFFRVRFPEETTDPISAQEAEETLAAASATLARVSDGNFQLAWTISPVLQLGSGRESYSGPGGFDQFLNDVRAAGDRAGYPYLDYDLDIVRHSGVPGFMGGNANLGVRGAQVQAPGATVIVHELGHNLGLNHANAWVTGALGLGAGSPPLPSNYPGQPDPRSIPVYPDSFLGHESIVGPGYSAEYGDPFDIMGSGSIEFSAIYRHQLGWMTGQSIALANPGFDRYRIQAADGTNGNPRLPWAIQLPISFSTPQGEHDYWIQLPPTDPNAETPGGILIRWGDPSETHGGSQLLAPMASSPGANAGLLLPPGKTFSDVPNGVHITLLSFDGNGNDRTAEVAVYLGNTAKNRAPVVTIDAASDTVDVNQSLSLNGTALDPDGDPLVWRWSFGDETFSTSTTNVTKSWRSAGDFVVHLEVSDMKGGVGRASVPIRVGQPNSFRISGRIVTEDGRPIAGARIHNGVSDAGTRDHRSVMTFSDSSGSYTLTGLSSGSYDLGAYLFGYSTLRIPPITLTDHDLNGVDLTAVELPRISVSAPQEIFEDAGITNLFLFTRSGSVDAPLTVRYRLGGSASAGRDYIRPLLDRVTFPAGSSNAILALNIQNDGVNEPVETIRLDVDYPVQAQRIDSNGNFYSIYYPGWELAIINGITNWVQTEPSYIPAAGASATVLLGDNDTPSSVIVSIAASPIVATEDPRVDSAFYLTRVGGLDRTLTLPLEISGTALNGTDYVTITTYVTFLPGETERTISIQPIVDHLLEPEEQIIIHIIPGTEYATDISTAIVTIRDNSEVLQTLSALVRPDGDIDLTLKAQPASRLILEKTTDFKQWIPIRTNLLFNTDTVTLTVPRSATNTFLRTVIRPD